MTTTRPLRDHAARRHPSGPARAGVGWSEQADSRQAGVEAAEQALRQHDLREPDLVLLYHTSKQDPRAVRGSAHGRGKHLAVFARDDHEGWKAVADCFNMDG